MVAVEDGAVGHIQPAAILDPNAGRGVQHAVDVQPGQRAVGAVADDHAVVGPAAVLGAVVGITVQVVQPDDDVGAVLDEGVVREARPERVADSLGNQTLAAVIPAVNALRSP
jgi:hypothetical protein